MSELVKAKFSQNNYLKNMLLKTGNKQFHEATSDTMWGTGAELASKALLTGAWTGQDLLGQIIEKTREELAVTNNSVSHTNQSLSAQSQLCDIINEDDLAPLSEDEDNEDNTETIQSHDSHVNEPKVSPRAKPLSPEKSVSPHTSALAGSPPVTSTPTASQHKPERKKSPVQLLQNIIGRHKRAAPPPPTTDGKQQRNTKSTSSQPRGNRVTRSLTATKGK